jgi:septal ring factor EnvC (AmiA/AmiB activator)
MKLRPVTFIYKSDSQGVKQYGLVAEEVDKVYPELVIHDDEGKVESVRYSMLTSMLLNELQKQAHTNEEQAERIKHLNSQISAEKEATRRTIAEQKASTERRMAQLEASSAREMAKRVALEERFANLERTIVAQHGGFKVETSFNR